MGTANLVLDKTIHGNSRLPILMFHSVNTVHEPGQLEPFLVHQFEAFIENLYRHGWRTITSRQAYDYNVHKVPIPEKHIWLTFDDGWEDNLIFAAPILKKYGYTASICPEVAKIGEPFRLTYDQLAELHFEYGWDIDSHGYAGHQPIPTGPDGETGSFYNDLMWLSDEGRLETLAERHERIKTDLKMSMDILAPLGGVHCFVYPASQNGATPELVEDTEAVLDELGIMGVLVIWPGQQLVNFETTPRHRLVRVGIGTLSNYHREFSPANFGIYAEYDGHAQYARFGSFDEVKDRHVAGNASGQIMTFGRDWKIQQEPVQVIPPVGSGYSPQTSFLIPSVMPNGDIFAVGITDRLLMKLDHSDLTSPALDAVQLGFYPFGLTNDGTYLYTMNDYGHIYRVDPETLADEFILELPDGAWGKYEQGIFHNGRFYVFDNHRKNIVVYDVEKGQFTEEVRLDDGRLRLKPLYSLDDQHILCFSENDWRIVAVKVN